MSDGKQSRGKYGQHCHHGSQRLHRPVPPARPSQGIHQDTSLRPLGIHPRPYLAAHPHGLARCAPPPRGAPYPLRRELARSYACPYGPQPAGLSMLRLHSPVAYPDSCPLLQSTPWRRLMRLPRTIPLLLLVVRKARTHPSIQTSTRVAQKTRQPQIPDLAALSKTSRNLLGIASDFLRRTSSLLAASPSKDIIRSKST
jgi:hypothetical protein